MIRLLMEETDRELFIFRLSRQYSFHIQFWIVLYPTCYFDIACEHVSNQKNGWEAEKRE